MENEKSKRQRMVARQIQRDLAEIIRGRGMAAFDGAMVTVSGVKMSPDLSLARVYVSIFPSDKSQKGNGYPKPSEQESAGRIGQSCGKTVEDCA